MTDLKKEELLANRKAELAKKVGPVGFTQAKVEQSLPGYMIALAMERLREENYEVRDDMLLMANRASVKPFFDEDVFTIRRLAKAVDDIAVQVFRESHADNARQLLAALVWMTNKLKVELNYPIDDDLLAVTGVWALDIEAFPEDWGSVETITRVMGNVIKAVKARTLIFSPLVVPQG